MFFLLFFVLCFGFWFFACRNRRWSYEPSGTERAKNILAERYARGEITSQEYLDAIAQID